MGSSEEDEAKLTVLNSELDVDYTEIFDLEESPDSDARFSNSFNINVNEGMEGAYQVDVKVYSESGDLMDSKVAELEVNSCEDKNCTDSDGKGYWGKGYVTTEKSTYTDECMDEKKLVEYICDGDEMDKIIALCPYKCSDGACVSEPIVETKPITLPKKKTCFLFWCW